MRGSGTIDRWAGVTPETTRDVAARRRGFVVMSALYLFCTVLLSIYGWVTEGLAPGRLIGIAAISVYVVVLVAARTGKPLLPLALTVLVVNFTTDTVYALLFGGISGSGGAMLLSVPFMAAFLLGARAAIISSVIVLIDLWLIFFFVDRAADPKAVLAEPIVISLIILVVSFYTVSFEQVTSRLARDLKESLADTEAARRAAEASSDSKSLFLAMISHELRTPMNGVIGMAEVLAQTDLHERQRTYVETIATSGAALLAIINDVLDFSKMEAGHVDLCETSYSLRDLLDQIVIVLAPEADRKGIDLTVAIDDDLPAAIFGDEGKVRQALLNLIGNAVKFTPRGYVAIEAVSRGDSTLVVSVRDSGIGIAADKLNVVFDAFQQAEADTTRTYGGTGLGLAISRRLAEAMGGTLTVSSEIGVGSCFVLTVPLVPAEELSTELPTVQRGDARPARRSLLVAEDNPVNQQVFGALLAGCGLDLTFAEDGGAALQAYRDAGAGHFAAVLMDINMPIMDGYEATRRIRQAEAASGWPRTRIVAVTAHAGPDAAACSYEAGMDAHLTKPVRRAALEAALVDDDEAAAARVA